MTEHDRRSACCRRWQGGSALEIADQQHFAWLARCFGRTDYLPLTPEDLNALSHTGEVIDKYPGTHLFKEGEIARYAYVILQGDVELYRTVGEERRVVGRAGEAMVIGDIAMFQARPYISSARAVEAVTAFRFDRERLLPALVDHPVITLRWLVAGLSQLESTQRRVLRLMRRTVKEQVAELLLDEADRLDEVRLSQAAVATLLGASRQTVNEALGELRDAGAADTAYRRIRIIDRSKLQSIAGRD